MNLPYPLRPFSVLLFVLIFTLTACGGGGGGGGDDGGDDGNNNKPPPPATSATISGTVAGTEIIAMNDNGDVIATDDTTGKTADAFGNYPFSLTTIPTGSNIRMYLVTGNGVFPMYFDSDSDGIADTNVFVLSEVTDIDLGFVDTAVSGQKGRAVPTNNPIGTSGVSAVAENSAVPATVSLVGTWGFARLKHRNSGSWATRSGLCTYNSDGTGATQWQENDNNTLSSNSKTWTWTATTNPDGSLTLIRTYPDSSIKTWRIVISDDSKVMLLDGTDNSSNQRFRVAVRMNANKTYADSDLSGDYYNVEYIFGSGGTHRAFSSKTSSDGAGNLSQTYTANDDGTITSGTEDHTYAVSADGSTSVDGSTPAFSGVSPRGELVIVSSASMSDVWGTPFLMKKHDRDYVTADVAGTWAYAAIGDSTGTSYYAEFGTLTCNSLGKCDPVYKQQRDGVSTIATSPTTTLTIQADGSFGASFGASVPAYAGAIGNDGNTLLSCPSFVDVNERRMIVAVRCNTCSELATGGGTGLTQLTDNPANDWHPYYSPDGTQIVFASDRSDYDDVWLMDADGSNPTQLTTTTAADSRPYWSPDGKQIVFESDRTGNWEIWTMNADGSAQTQVTDNAAKDTHPAWSPDGKHIAFQSNRDGNNDIWLMNQDGTGLTKLTTNTNDDSHPMWSPDGTQIAFARNLGSRDIWVMNADGSNQHALTSAPADEQHADWSPDGTQIAYRSDKAGNYDVWIMNADGSNQHQLTTNPANDRNPDWSPDGTKIMFRSDRTGNQEIWTYTLP